MTARKTRAKKIPAKKKTRKVQARKPRQKQTRTVAEARGLAQRDAVIAANSSTPEAPEVLVCTTILNQQFRVWSAIMRMSPLPFVLQQQAVVAKLIMDFMLPTSRPADAGKKE
jgi:hypothetical protein